MERGQSLKKKGGLKAVPSGPVKFLGKKMLRRDEKQTEKRSTRTALLQLSSCLNLSLHRLSLPVHWTSPLSKSTRHTHRPCSTSTPPTTQRPALHHSHREFLLCLSTDTDVERTREGESYGRICQSVTRSITLKKENQETRRRGGGGKAKKRTSTQIFFVPIFDLHETPLPTSVFRDSWCIYTCGHE